MIKGVPVPEELRRRISERLKGRKLSDEARLRRALLRKPTSGETRKKMSITRRKLGGRPRSTTLRKLILTRDNFTCRICGFRDLEILEIDHIQPSALHPELNYSLDNLWALCPNCHKRKSLRDMQIIREYRELCALLAGEAYRAAN